MKRLPLFLLLSLAFASLARAEDIYIAQTALGSSNGQDAGDAYAYTFFNTAGNWANPKVSGKIGPGDVVHLVATITNNLSFQLGGLLGTPIEVRWEQGAKLSVPYLDVSVYGGLVDIFQKSNVVLNGDATGGTQGIIECTANGTSLGHSVATTAIRMQSVSNVLIENLTIRNIYVRVAGTDVSSGTGSNGIDDSDSNGLGLSNFHVTNCVLRNTGFNGIIGSFGAGNSNWEFDHIVASGNNWDIGTGDRNSGSSLSYVSVHDCVLNSWANWNETGSDAFHHNGWHLFAVNGGKVTHVRCFRNVFGPGWGNSYQTGGDFYEGDLRDIWTFDNVYVCAPGEAAGNGLITIGTGSGDASAQSHHIYSNTFIGGAAGTAIQIGGGTTAVSYDLQNNVGIGNGNGIWVAVYNNTNLTITADHNFAYGYESSPYVYSSNGNGVFYNFSQWQGFGYDANGSASANPNLDVHYHPSSGSPLIGAGKNLSSFFQTDAAGAVRKVATTQPWTVGAFLIGTGDVQTTPASGP